MSQASDGFRSPGTSTQLGQVVDGIKDLSRSDFEQFSTELPKLIDPAKLPYFANASLVSALRALEPDQKAEALRAAIQAQPETERAKLIQQVGNTAIAPPTQKVRDKLWMIVVVGFAIVLVGSFLTLAIGVFIATSGTVKPELVLTMFTSVVGFLAGLFVPSPINRRRRRVHLGSDRRSTGKFHIPDFARSSPTFSIHPAGCAVLG